MKKETRKEHKQRELDKMISGIDIKNYTASNHRREISIFCTTLFSNMTFKQRFIFVIKGQYIYPLIKTNKQLMKKKSEENIKAEKAKEKEDTQKRIRKFMKNKNNS